MRDALGGRMRTVRSRKSVVHENIAKRCELGGKCVVVCLLALMKSRIFEKEDLPVLHCLNGALGVFAHTIVGKPDRLTHRA